MTLSQYNALEYLSSSVYYHVHAAARNKIIDSTWESVYGSVASCIHRYVSFRLLSPGVNTRNISVYLSISSSVYKNIDNLIKSYDT